MNDTVLFGTDAQAVCDALLRGASYIGTVFESVKPMRNSSGLAMTVGACNVPEGFALQLQWYHVVHTYRVERPCGCYRAKTDSDALYQSPFRIQSLVY